MDKRNVNLDIEIKTKHQEILEKIFKDDYYGTDSSEVLCILKAFNLTGEVLFEKDTVNIIITGENDNVPELVINQSSKPKT